MITESEQQDVPPPGYDHVVLHHKLNPTSGAVGTSVTVTGTNFGATQWTITISFSGAVTTPTSRSATSIVGPVPAGTTTGNVVVTVGS